MKTLADFKRALTIGSKWKAVYVPYNNDLGTREVIKRRSNAVAFKMDNSSGESWLNFPPANCFKFNGNIVEVYTELEGKLLLTYEAMS